MADWQSQPDTLRARLHHLPPLDPTGLRTCQINAIQKLEASFQADRPRALVQMATGAGKTFTAITSVYRLLKFAKAKRILFLVDTRNLGEQAEQEFRNFSPTTTTANSPNSTTSSGSKPLIIAASSQVCICTIQRMYSILKDEPLDDSAEETTRTNSKLQRQRAPPVVYNPRFRPNSSTSSSSTNATAPSTTFGARSIEYFDASLIGLTATPDDRTYGFFKRTSSANTPTKRLSPMASTSATKSYRIDTQVTRYGDTLKAQTTIEKRERLTRAKRWEAQDQDETYTGNATRPLSRRPRPNPHRHPRLPRQPARIFPWPRRGPEDPHLRQDRQPRRRHHQIVRDEFAEGNDFCKKSPMLGRRSQIHPHPLPQRLQPAHRRNCRHDRHRNRRQTARMPSLHARRTQQKLFRTNERPRHPDGQRRQPRKVTPSAKSAKTHYVIVDAIGVTKSCKTASQPLITKPTVPIKDLATGVMMGIRDEDTVSSLVGRLARLDRELDHKQQERITAATGGVKLSDIVHGLIQAIDADNIETAAKALANGAEPTDAQRDQARDQLVAKAAAVITGPVITLIDNIRREREQTIDHDNLDNVIGKGWSGDAAQNAETLAKDFAAYLEENRDRIEALSIFYSQPARRANITYPMIKAVLDALKTDRPKLAPFRVWQAYALLDQYKGTSPANELTALVALIRRVCGIDAKLAPYADTVRLNFREWIDEASQRSRRKVYRRTIRMATHDPRSHHHVHPPRPRRPRHGPLRRKGRPRQDVSTVRR